jgi:hypothetical protein
LTSLASRKVRGKDSAKDFGSSVVFQSEPITAATMKNLSCPTLVAAFSFIVSSASVAQQPPAAAESAALELRMNLSIDVIPIDELPAVLEKALGKPVNLIIPPEASGITLPRLKLHQITVPQLFEALQMASSTTGAEPAYRFEQAAENIWVFKTSPGAPESISPVTSQVFALEPYLKNLKVEDITTAIQTATQGASSREGKPELKFHEETKLLIASGSPAQLGVVQSVLAALGSSAQSKQEKDMATALESARAQLQSQTMTAEFKLDALQQEHKRLEARAAELEARNVKLESELVRLRAEVDLAAAKAKN